jgi:lysozyme
METISFQLPAVNFQNTLSSAGTQFLMNCEGGLRKTPYNDSKQNCTVGYGHLMQPPHKRTANDIKNGAMNQQQAEAQLRQDVSAAAAAVNNMVNVPLTQNQFDALVSFTFNDGPGNLQRLVNSSGINTGHINQVVLHLLLSTGGGAGTPARRANEGNIFDAGAYADGRYQ